MPYTTTQKYEYNGKSLSLYEWAAEYKMNHSTLYGRLLQNWSMERALTEPVGKAPYQPEVKRPRQRKLTRAELVQNLQSRSRVVEALKQEEVQGLSEYRPRKPHPREKEKEFTYIFTKHQKQKLGTFGMIACSCCQRLNAEENISCTQCGVVFKMTVKIKSKIE